MSNFKISNIGAPNWGLKRRKLMLAAYAFMQWCDRLSLILCQQELLADERFLEISKGSDGERYDIMQRRDDLFLVKPWQVIN